MVIFHSSVSLPEGNMINHKGFYDQPRLLGSMLDPSGHTKILLQLPGPFLSATQAMSTRNA